MQPSVHLSGGAPDQLERTQRLPAMDLGDQQKHFLISAVPLDSKINP